MKKIGGVNMEAIARLTGKLTKDRKCKKQKRNCTVYQSLDESLKEVKLHKEGKIQLRTWNDLYKDLKR